MDLLHRDLIIVPLHFFTIKDEDGVVMLMYNYGTIEWLDE